MMSLSRRKSRRLSRFFRSVVLALVAGLSVGAACKRESESAAPKAADQKPSVRLYVLSTVAGAIEPCGCRKDMLGGIDHAASFIHAQKEKAPDSLVLSAGPLLFMDPSLDAQRTTQDRWKADAMASAASELPLAAWTPGANDFAAGTAEFETLAGKTKGTVLAANLSAPQAKQARVFQVGPHKVGVTGVSSARSPLGVPEGVTASPLEPSLREGLASLQKDGAQILVALVSAERGEALRLAERVPGFDVLVVGKSFDRGEGNDAPTAPVLVGGTLVVQPPNHLQAIAIVDLFVRDGYDFKDGAGLAQAEKRDALTGRIGELERRIAGWEKQGVDKVDLDARRADLKRLRAELAGLSPKAEATAGSEFRYTLSEVREGLGADPGVEKRLAAYYQRVNEHNREAFKDRKPPPVAAGESHYIGAESCDNCHDEAVAFWKTTPHASAYATLTRQHKEFNLDCVGCHVTGYEKPGGTTVTHVEGLTAVQCETCHGPGSRHEDDPENPAFIVKKPEKTLCTTCHHPPHVADDWNADAAWPHILGKGHGR